MYTETQESLRNSLWNFMGSIVTSSVCEENKRKENVSALMCEELCKFCKKEDEQSIDLQAAKPILKAAVWVLEARKLEMKNSRDSLDVDALIAPIDRTIEDMTNLINTLNSYIDKI